MARSNLSIPSGFVPLNATEFDPITVEVASNYGTALYVGDPVIAVSDGTVARTPAGSAAGAATDGITGIITKIVQYKDSTGIVRRNSRESVPANTTWTSAAERTLLQIIPSYAPIRYRCRGSASVADVATARSLRFENADLSYGTADAGLGLSGARLNIATHATTNTLQFRIVEVVDMVQNDPTQANFILDVIVNLPYGWPIIGHSLTGV